MNYRRVLVVAKLGTDSRPTFGALRVYASSAEQIIVLAQQPAHQWNNWLTPLAPSDEGEDTLAALETLRARARVIAPEVDIQLASELTEDAVARLITSTGVDLVAIDSHAHDALPLVVEVRKRASVAVLYVPGDVEPARLNGPLLCVGLSNRERWSVAAFLNAHAGKNDRAVLLSGTALSAEEVRQMSSVSGLPLEVEVAPPSVATLHRMLAEDLGVKAALIVLPRFPPAFLLPKRRGRPVLILPSVGTTTGEAARALDVPDLIDDGASIRVRAEYAIGVGRRTPIADQELAFVRQGSDVVRAFSRAGECELPSGLGTSVRILRRREEGSATPLASIETQVSILRPDGRPRLLFDAELRGGDLRAIRNVTWAEPLGVRVRSIRSCRSLRARLRAAGLPPVVIDTAAVLDEGDALDVSPLVDAVRLARTGARLRAYGFNIPAIVYRGAHEPSTTGFAALRPTNLGTFAPSRSAAPPSAQSPTVRLDVTTASETIEGNRIQMELDNPTARQWLLEAIASSQQRVHFQVYMALDDDVGRPVEAALAAAAARGVTVRVLVDSLHGLHGSFGLNNPILGRLSGRPGVQFRLGKPIGRGSSLEDLKQRDHRKLVVVDGRLALLGGRNLSHEYYSGFDEVPLDAGMTWRMVPWLDAGARVEGPAVAALERSFLQAWTDAGGEPFDISTPPPAGTAAARVVVHRGLRDAYAVEAQLALIESARSHVYVVNGFPLLLEIQHALLRALKRGVRVRTLVGNLTPRHSEGAFAGPWATVRTAWTSFVHSRMDPLVAAGGECYEYVVPHQDAWHPALGDIRPHVHAKAMSVDGRSCAVGSANFDVTAAYWESELLLVVEDGGIAASVEARFDELLATSRRIDPGDPDWRQRADLRRWMRYWPGVLSG